MPKKTKKDNKELVAKQDNLPIKAEGENSANELAPKVKKAHKYHKNNISSVGEILVNIASKLIKKSLFLLIPWIVLSVGILMTGSYKIFKEYFVGMAYPWWYLALVAFLLFVVYGFIGFAYGLIMALLHTILSISSSLGEIIKKTVLRVKNSIESRVDRFADTLEQSSLLELIKKTFEDISKDIRRYATKTMFGVLIAAFLGGVLFLVRKIVVTSFKQVKNKADFFTKMSIRFSLLIAVILNLKLFTKIALFVGYIVGILLVLSQVLIWYILR